MFRKNESYKQKSLFGIDQQLSVKQRQMWDKSLEHKFFKIVFQQIDETRFSVLFSSSKSRPNVPINQLVGALILKHLNDWTYEELFKNLSFNLLTRHAIGIQELEQNIFSEASIFNFQNRVIEYFVQTGEDLLNEVFDNWTTQQLQDFGIKTSIQRGDSFLIGSNIFDYSRLQLLIEVLLRLYRVLDKGDKGIYQELLSAYSRKSSGQYIYAVAKERLPKEIEKLSMVYHKLYIALKGKYKENKVFNIFERVYKEHFTIVNNQLRIKPKEEIASDSLMAPDDPQATYRKKGVNKSKGYVGHVSETAHPDNIINLITDAVVYPNNKDDAQILEERLPAMMDKTPTLNEYFADGLYGSPKVDELMERYNVTQYQNAIRGRRSYGKIHVEVDADGFIKVHCGGGQQVIAQKTKAGWKAVFKNLICLKCPLFDKCKTLKIGGKTKEASRIFYFNKKVLLRHKRLKNFEKLPDEKKKIRANVEATVKEAKKGIKNGKVRVRGLVRVSFYMILTSIGINFKRIYRFFIQFKENPQLIYYGLREPFNLNFGLYYAIIKKT